MTLWRWVSVRRLACVIAVVMYAAWGCGGDDGDGGDGGQAVEMPDEQVLTIEATLVDEVIVAGGELALEITGAEAIVPGGARIVLDGDLGGQGLQATLNADVDESADPLRLSIPWERLEALGLGSDSDYAGSMRVEIDDLGGGLQGVESKAAVLLQFRTSLTPSLTIEGGVLEIFPNDDTTFSGDGVLRDGEGVTELVLDGTFLTEGGGAPTLITATVPVRAGASRSDLRVNWPVVVFGIEPGTFSGSVKPRNSHAQSDAVEGDAVEVEISLLRAEIDGFDPPEASRGEIMNVVGRGFIPADANLGQSMYFLLDGMFQTVGGTVLDFTGDKAVQVAPEEVPRHNEARLVLRSQIEDQSGRLDLVGLTATPGSFQGAITPVLVSGVQIVAGQRFQGSLTIAPTRQYVYVRFLPNFIDALDDFGLRTVEPEIRARIFEVLARDYAGFNIAFADFRPEGAVEYSIIEVGGPDPNNAGLFGLDNSAGKDTGNVRLNDIIGSENADSGELGFYVFGGVFIGSFTTFSPTLEPDSEVASAAFDDIFAFFMPELGGTPIDASEWPEGPRQAEIEAAIRALGSIVGNTVTHEIGHSLGMSFFQEDLFSETNRFHNDFDEEGAIMDAGQNRPFEERAELEGATVPHFNTRNTRYLEMILPLP